jgi:imidazolonepropionase-like amidohydrolase
MKGWLVRQLGFLVPVLGVSVLALPALAATAGDLVVRADRLMTGTGETIEDGVVVIENGAITAVGSADQVRVPSGVEVVRAVVATPGLVDGRSTVGLSGALNQPHDQDQLEASAPLQPELRAIDAYNPREQLVSWLREHGVTTVHTGHAPGEVISGQTLIAKTAGATVTDTVMVPFAGLAATLGEGALIRDDKGARKSPGTRAKAVALLRAQLIAAREYQDKQAAAADDDDIKTPDRNLALESLAAVLNGEVPLIIEAHRHHDLVTALRLREEFGFRLILSGAADAHMLVEEIREAGVPVLLHPLMIRTEDHGERENFSFTTPARLLEAGIPVALQSGFEGYVPKTRVVLFEAALALGYGLTAEQALRLITQAPAEILGIADRVGSLEVGKDGDVALFDGDPFEYATHVTGTVIRGIRVSDTER